VIQKRPCGDTGIELGAVGFGAMRIHGEDIDAAARVVAAAAEAGFNYFETCERYCRGTSEVKVGKGLAGLRDKVYLSTKSAPRDHPKADDVRAAIDESLERLGVDYVDFYHLWDTKLDEFTEIAAKPGGTLEGIRRAMDEGLIRHLGITTHDTAPNGVRLLETGEFEVVTVQYNLINRTAAPVIAEAGKRGIGVIAMGPLHGGILAADSDFARDMISLGAGDTAAEVALRFVLSNPDVTCAISGMTTVAEVAANARTGERLRPLTTRETARLEERTREFVGGAGRICTLCEYCMPCPQDIWIPGVLTLASAARLLGLFDEASARYARFAESWAEAGHEGPPCIECGACVERCPQGIDIPTELKAAHEILKIRITP